MGNGGRSSGWVLTERQLPFPPQGDDVTPGERARGKLLSGPERGTFSIPIPGFLAPGPEERERAVGRGGGGGPRQRRPRAGNHQHGIPVSRREGVEFLSGLPGLQALPRVGDQIIPDLVWVGMERTFSCPSDGVGIPPEKGHTAPTPTPTPPHAPSIHPTIRPAPPEPPRVS